MKDMAIQQGKKPEKEKANRINEGIPAIKEIHLAIADAMKENIFTSKPQKH